VRLSLNRHASTAGERYTVEAEIEYDAATRYDVIVGRYERDIMRAIYPFRHHFECNKLSLKDLFSQRGAQGADLERLR